MASQSGCVSNASDSTNKLPRQQSAVQGDRDIVINEMLCYAVNKYRQLVEPTLKTVLFDFYSEDACTEAKELLRGRIDDLDIAKWPRPPNRRRINSKENPGAKQRQEIEDIYGMINYIDQNMLSAKMPIFVAADPNMLPSMKLVDGDLQCVLMKLRSITDKVESMD